MRAIVAFQEGMRCEDDVLHLCDAITAFSMLRRRSRAICAFLRYEISMLDNIFAFHANVLDAQA